MTNRSLLHSAAPLLIALLAVIGLQTAAAWWGFDTRAIFIAQAVLFAVMTVQVVWYLVRSRRDWRHGFDAVGVKLGSPGSDALNGFVLPLCILHPTGELVWYNDAFRSQILNGEDHPGVNVNTLLPEGTLTALEVGERVDVTLGKREYTVWQNRYVTPEGENARALYWVEDTKLKQTAAAYTQSRSAVVLIRIDSLEDLDANLPESEQAALRSAVEREIETWAGQKNSLCRKLANGDYLLVMEDRQLAAALQDRFDLLERVRALGRGEQRGATLSVGVGRGADTPQEGQQMARQALDMALGRGGDQAAVKNAAGFEFYGGTTAGDSERRTKVRTRVIASALRELIDGSDHVLIMGHRLSDLDCVGAAWGLWRAVTSFGRSCRMVIRRESSMAQPLLRAMDEAGLTDQIIGEEQALEMCTHKTLLIIVDTHRPGMVDCPALLDTAASVVVIDHHRKMVDHIQNAVIFYHEPYASSACEMVTELLPYFGERLIGRNEANALMAGIALDTRNFVLRTGARTFEASAYLRRRGSDPVAVRRMFADSIEVYKVRASVVSSAEIRGNVAIAADPRPEVTHLVAAQAADEMLSIEGVDASFVLFVTEKTVNISARSLGAVNVQLIMEALGGGGHFTMAAAQLPDVTLTEAKDRLLAAIDRYRQTRPAEGEETPAEA